MLFRFGKCFVVLLRFLISNKYIAHILVEFGRHGVANKQRTRTATVGSHAGETRMAWLHL